MKVHISRHVLFEEGSKSDWKGNVDGEVQSHFSTIPHLVVDEFDQMPPIQVEFTKKRRWRKSRKL